MVSRYDVENDGERDSLSKDESRNHPEGIPPNLAQYYRNAPLKRLKHPLEESIFSSLIITLVSVAVAILLGLPLLLISGLLLMVVLFFRYGTLVFTGFCQYIHFLCSNRNVPTERPNILPTDRLAFANDVRWLNQSRKNSQMCQPILHTVLIFDGKMDLANLRNLIQLRVLNAMSPGGELAYPRLVQKIIPHLAGYQWVSDPDFDIQNHVLLGPTHLITESQVQKYLSSLLMESLPKAKPLWEIRVLPGCYGTQKDTLAILRVHQCLADGMTLVRILSQSLSDQQLLHIPHRPHFAGLNFSFNVLRSFIVGPLTLFLWICMTFRDVNFFTRPLNKPLKKCYPSSKEKKTSSSGDWRDENNHSHNSGENKPSANPLLSTEGGGGVGESSTAEWNVVWSSSISVPKVYRIKQIMRSSLNDVLLSACTGSIRLYLQSQGINFPEDVKVVIPVDLRNDISTPKPSANLGCKVSCIVASVPSGVESAIPRLWASRRLMDEVKASADPIVAYGTTIFFMNVLPNNLGISVLDSITNKASLLFSNLPGPPGIIVIGGFPLKGIYPIYPPNGSLRLSVTLITYADQIHLTVVSHKSLPRAGPLILSGISSNLDQLSNQLSQRRVPGESRRANRPPSIATSEMTKPPTRQIHFQLQMVQEELQNLTSQLKEDPEYTLEETPSETDNTELRSRVKTLKNEFVDLMSELRRRSSIVEGLSVSFEDEEGEEEYRKPRNRTLSVVSMSHHRRTSIFSQLPRNLATPESSSHIYSSEEDLAGMVTPSSPDVHNYSGIRLSVSPIKTTAV